MLALRAHLPPIGIAIVFDFGGSDSTERLKSHDSKFFNVSFMLSNVIQRRILGFAEDLLLFERLRAHTVRRKELYRTSAERLRDVSRKGQFLLQLDRQGDGREFEITSLRISLLAARLVMRHLG